MLVPPGGICVALLLDQTPVLVDQPLAIGHGCLDEAVLMGPHDLDHFLDGTLPPSPLSLVKNKGLGILPSKFKLLSLELLLGVPNGRPPCMLVPPGGICVALLLDQTPVLVDQPLAIGHGCLDEAVLMGPHDLDHFLDGTLPPSPLSLVKNKGLGILLSKFKLLSLELLLGVPNGRPPCMLVPPGGICVALLLDQMPVLVDQPLAI